MDEYMESLMVVVFKTIFLCAEKHSSEKNWQIFCHYFIWEHWHLKYPSSILWIICIILVFFSHFEIPYGLVACIEALWAAKSDS
jgi:hypothetical protein